MFVIEDNLPAPRADSHLLSLLYFDNECKEQFSTTAVLQTKKRGLVHHFTKHLVWFLTIPNHFP